MNKEINDIEYNPHVGALLDHNGTFTQYGITLLDHFAGLAMQGIIASGKTITPENCASWAYKVADAMLTARKEVSGE